MEDQEETNPINNSLKEEDITPENTDNKEEIFTRDIENIGSLGVHQSTSTNINTPGDVASLAGKEEERLAGVAPNPEIIEEDLLSEQNNAQGKEPAYNFVNEA